MFQLCRNQPLEEKVKELEETLQAKNSEISKLTTYLENLQIKNEKLESKNHELEKTIQTQNDSFAKLEVKVEDLEDRNVDLNKTLEEQNNPIHMIGQQLNKQNNGQNLTTFLY